MWMPRTIGSRIGMFPSANGTVKDRSSFNGIYQITWDVSSDIGNPAECSMEPVLLINHWNDTSTQHE